jgi:CHASE3 domain sensor protein
MERADSITQEEKYLEDARVALREYLIRLKEARQSESMEDISEYLKLAEEANREYVKAYNKYMELVKSKKENKA